MKNEIHTLFRSLQRLADACADHDITFDIFVESADREAYHYTLGELRDCISRIAGSGISRADLESTFRNFRQEVAPDLAGFIHPESLLPLMGLPFTREQEALVTTACREWADAVTPSRSAHTELYLRALVRPLTLADLLDPVNTRMQRFPVLLLIESGLKGLSSLSGPVFETGDEIPVPASDDPALFSGLLHQALFRFFIRNGLIGGIFFRSLLLKTIFDTSIIETAGEEALLLVYQEDDPLISACVSAGRELSGEEGSINDIRILYRVVYSLLTIARKEQADAVHDSPVPFDQLEHYAAYVLAGWATAAARTLSRNAGTGPVDDTSISGEPRKKTAVSCIVDWMRATAVNTSGRTRPDEAKVRELDKTLKELERLLRAISGDYSWRSAPMAPAPETFRPPVIIRPGQNILLYDRDDLAWRSSGACRALALEAIYREWYGVRINPRDLPEPDRVTFLRLSGIVFTPRAVRKGYNIHPGAKRLLEILAKEEYDPVIRPVEQDFLLGLTLPDQFLTGARAEGLTGKPARSLVDLRDIVNSALDATRDARNEVTDPAVSDETCIRILQERIWPVVEKLYYCPDPRAGEPRLTPALHRIDDNPQVLTMGEADRVDTSVPATNPAIGSATGRTIAGTGPSLLEPDGFNVPGGPSLQGNVSAPGGNDYSPAAGRGSTPAHSHTGPGSGSGQQPGQLQSEITDNAERLIQFCNKGLGLLDHSRDEYGSAHTKGTPAEEPNDTPDTLADLARETASIAASLHRGVSTLSAKGIQNDHDSDGHLNMTNPVRGSADQWDSLLKLSEKVQRAAGEFLKTVSDAKEDPGLPGEGATGGAITGSRTGVTRKALMELQQAGIEFQRIAGATIHVDPDEWRAVMRLPETDETPGDTGQPESRRSGRLEPAFVADSAGSEELWESLSYFDASYSDESESSDDGIPDGRITREMSERRYEQGEQALTREAEQYLTTLRQRTPGDWETMDEKAERIRRVALFESHCVREDDYTLYQRFYQPVAGLVAVARKNIQQALQKNRSYRDLTELLTGDDIDEENLAAVRTTMRIFRDEGREPDRTEWCISLLIDASSSMHDETVAKKLESTIRTAILFGEALNRIDAIRFEITAFADTEYIPLKRYKDEWNIHQGCYLISQVIQASGGTNDVGAVSSAIDRMNRLRMSSGANRMIFVISDGQSGVGGREQMKMILSHNRETRIFGWGVGPDMEKIEETYLPYGTWVPDIADLPRSMGEILRREIARPAMAGWRDEQRPADCHADKGEGEDICTN
jgi:hypothetical protein